MDALMANYGSDSDDDNEPATVAGGAPEPQEASVLLPPPPLDLLQPPNFVGLAFLNLSRSFWGSVVIAHVLEQCLLQITQQLHRGVASGVSPMWKATMRCMSTSLVCFFWLLT